MSQTIQTYQDIRGATAYLKKEAATAPERNAKHWNVLDKINIQGLNILDIGCGFGRDVAAMRKRGAQAWGIDISRPLLNEAEQHVGKYFFEGDFLVLETSPIQPLHMIWACAVLVHVPKLLLATCLQRWVSWLQPGGYIMLASKYGEGEKIYTNLGADLPREMVLYKPTEILSFLPDYEVIYNDVAHSARSDGDEYFMMILRKPIS